jgi:heme-degrading monooxygenase HmoA
VAALQDGSAFNNGGLALIVRIWRTAVRDWRLDDYRDFAQRRSLPMFGQQSGCRGVVFASGAKDCAVISFWDDEDDVARLDSSPTYQEVAGSLLDADILQGEQRVEVFDAEIGFIDLP